MAKTVSILTRLAATLVAAAPFTAAMAADSDVPRLNTAITCRAAQTSDNKEGLKTNIGQDYDGCMADENQARQKASELWSKVKAGDRQLCASLATNTPAPSYVELWSCLQMYEPNAVNATKDVDGMQAAPVGHRQPRN